MRSPVSKIAVILLLGHFLILSGLWLAYSKRLPSSASAVTNSKDRVSQDDAIELARLEAKEQKIAETVWAKELLAEECGRVIESFWDSLNASTNKLSLAAAFQVDEIILGNWAAPRTFPHGVELRESSSQGATLSHQEWQLFVNEFENRGWRLEQTEFRQNHFDLGAEGRPSRSLFYFSAHFVNVKLNQRAALEGDLTVDWAPTRIAGERPEPQRVDASHLILKERTGKPPFQNVLFEQIGPPQNSYSIDPLLVYDLDGDGLSEIILVNKNLVYRRQSNGEYKSAPLCRYPQGLISTAVLADFDGDGWADFLCVNDHGLVLFKGSNRGEFNEPGRLVWPSPSDIKYPMVLTCGDIDQDGDLDLFLAQYRVPYENGALPTPYYDANDGFPAYLLLNDGHGNFTDVTTARGLEKKRKRRTYSGSFIDLNGDGYLDLAVASDFAGLDVYRNDGRGHFSDVTRAWIPEPHGFGMGLATADFNRDGRLDLLMIGMTSPTVDRLEHLGLTRPGLERDTLMRPRMTFGNRLYLSRSEGGFEQTNLSKSISRSGWSWGCTAFDFDNDGFPDVYIGNGLESRESVRDYESEYWLHDRYIGNSEEDSLAYLYFKKKFARTRGRGQSYGGYEKNRLYWNREGESFLEIGHLFGVALPQDSRNVVSDDLDGDGRMDLIVTSLEAWPQTKQSLRVYRNILEGSGNWIGFRFREEPRKSSPIGVGVEIEYQGHHAVREIITGDSYRSQHPAAIHFGLGESRKVEIANIRWPTGETLTIHEPAVNQYHLIHGPEKPANPSAVRN